MSIDIAQVQAKPLWLIASVFGLYLIKSPIVYVLARMFGKSRSQALEAGLLLGQGGEFAFLIVGLGYELGLIPGDTAQFMLIVTGLAMFATPPVAHIARSLARALEAREADRDQRDTDIPTGLSGHVIVVGYGRVGQMLGAVLDSQEIPHVGLDMDAQQVAHFRSAGAGVFFGDARQPDILRKFGVERAAALVITMDRSEASEQVVTTACRYWPHLVIYARARDHTHAARLIKCGANHAIPETIEASLQLGEMVLMGVGVPDDAARHAIESRRQAEHASIDESRVTAASK